jgi:acetyl-CoA acyltransferase 1
MQSRINHRLSVLEAHIQPQQNSEMEGLSAAFTSAVGVKSPDDIVIIKSVRTAVGKAKRGSFKNTGPDNLLAPVLKHLVQTTPQIKPELYGDVVIGTVLPPGAQGATEVRVAALLAGLPDIVPCTTVNRQCSSGLQAIANVASAIKAGYYDIGIAGGVESMSSNSMDRWDGGINQEALQHPSAKGCYLNMGQTSENVAERYGVSRETQDQFAALSHKKAAEAIKAGKFRDEIVPVTVTVEDDKGNSKTITVSQDEGVRADTTAEKLGKLRPVFKEGGTTTAGNSSQVSDGAAACIITKRSVAQKLGLPIFGVLRSFAAVGVEPAVMGIGPAVAIPAAVKMAGISLQDVDVYEINEAFASQAVYCVQKLGIPVEKVNPNGGAIALGHPLGCTGARQTATILNELKRRNARFGVVSMCIGSGMGAAAVYEREN